MPIKTQVIALYSPDHSLGLGSAVTYLAEKFGYEVYEFAYPIKKALVQSGITEATYRSFTLPELMVALVNHLPQHLEIDLNKISDQQLNGYEFGHVLEMVRAELVKACGADVLAKLLHVPLREARKAGKKIVIPDISNMQEHELLKDNDAFFARIENQQEAAGPMDAGNEGLINVTWGARIFAGADIKSLQSQINSILSNRNRVLLCSDNPEKIAEYRRLFGRHSVTVEVTTKEDFDDLDALAKRVSDPSSRVLVIVRDTNILCDSVNGVPLKHPEDINHHGISAENVCFFDMRRVDAGGEISPIESRKSSIGGWIDNATQGKTEGVFGWDDIFRNGISGLLNHDMQARGLKVSARDLILSQVLIEYFYPRARSDLQQMPLQPADDLPFEISPVDFFLKNPIVQLACPEASPLRNAFHAALSNGIFVKAQPNRRAGNYFNTNVNGGLPLVPKRDPVQEINYMAHDVVHHLIKEPVYVGVPENEKVALWRATYCICLKMSESNAQVLIDMLFADATIKSGIQYDYNKRPTYPLFKQLIPPTGLWDRQSLFALFDANARFEILGDDAGFRAMVDPKADRAAAERALQTFKNQYGRTFAVDWQWIGNNFNNMHGRNEVFTSWAEMVGPERFAAAGLVTLKNYVEALPDDLKARSHTLGVKVEELYDVLVPKMIDAVLDRMFVNQPEPPRAQVIGAGFRRWTLGQALLFPAYDFHPAVAARGPSFLSMLDVSNETLVERIGKIRKAYDQALVTLTQAQLVTPDDQRTYATNFPFFDPQFMYNRSLEKPVEDIRIAAELFGNVPPSVVQTRYLKPTSTPS